MIKCSTSFNNAFNNTALYNCDIEIYTLFFTYKYTKENLTYYKTSLSNKYVCETILREETTFEIKNWDKISSSEKAFFQKNYPIFVFYIVNGVKSTGARYSRITDIKVNYKGDTAVIRAEHKISTLTDALPTSYATFTMVDALKPLIAPYNTFTQQYEVEIGLPLNNLTITNDFTGVRNIYGNITKAEAIQNIIASCGGGFKLDFDGTKFDASVITLGQKIIDDIYNAYQFPTKNVYDNTEKNKLDTYNNIQVVGYTFGTSQHTILNTHFTATQSSFTKEETIGELKYYISNVHIENNANTYIANDFVVIGTSILANFTGVAVPAGYDFVVMGVDIYEPSPSNEDGLSISAPNCASSSTTQLDKVKTDALTYYSIEDEITFSCRINPCIEPLDIIETLGHKILVEKVEINFNGGYQGRITGRIIDNFATTILAPTINDVQVMEDDDAYKIYCSLSTNLDDKFTINKLVVEDDDGNSMEVEAYKITISQITSYLAYIPQTPMQDWANEIHNNQLTTNLYCAFKIGNTIGEKGLLYARQIIAYAPNVEDDEISDEEDYYWLIKNDNAHDVTLKITYSGGTLQFSLNAGQSMFINKNNAPALEQSIYNYIHGIQFDAVVAYFEDDNGAVSSNVILVQ